MSAKKLNRNTLPTTPIRMCPTAILDNITLQQGLKETEAQLAGPTIKAVGLVIENHSLRQKLARAEAEIKLSSNPIWKFLDQSGLDEAEILRLSYAFSPQELDELNGIVLKIFIEQGEDTKVLARRKKAAAKLISAAQTSNCSVSIFDSQECLSALRVDAVSDEFSHTIFIGKASTIASLMEEEIFFRAKRKLRFIQGEKINAVNLLRKLAARSIRQAKHASRQGK
ncbi:MAG: hypothetical protein Q4A21_02145 [bacterium]|nr:hypothetical protein [bacterium]